MNSAREKILQNLRNSAAMTSASTVVESSLPSHDDATIYRNYEPAHQQPLQLFAEKIAALKGEFYRVTDATAAARTLRELLTPFITQQHEDILSANQAQSAAVTKWVARHHHPLLDQIFGSDDWLAENVQVIDHQLISSADFAHFDVGITAVDFLVARTGSIVLSTATAGGRRLSVLPPFHIAVATTNQLVVSLDEAMKTYHQRAEFNRSSYATIITGPSRTSDIEKILVLGAHGPKRLAVIMVNGSASSLTSL